MPEVVIDGGRYTKPADILERQMGQISARLKQIQPYLIITKRQAAQ
ncbi:MAG: hypothetical protein ACXWT4_19665 [Methylobacter sp.]